MNRRGSCAPAGARRFRCAGGRRRSRPRSSAVALLMPATSPSLSSITSTLKPLRSQYFRYWRSSICAQSQASVPPAPAWMSRKQLLGSAGLLNMRRNSSCATVSRSAIGKLLDVRQRVEVAIGLRHVVQLGVVGELARQMVDGLDHGFQRLLLAPQFLRALRLVPDGRVLQRGVDLVQPQRLALVVKDTPLARRCALSGRQAGRRFG